MAKILIGNATLYLAQAEDVLADIGPADSLVMDPNYLFNTAGGGKYRKARKNLEKIKAAGMDKGFDINTLDPALYKSIITFCHNNQLHLLLPWFAEHYHRHVVCFWEKTNPTPFANKNYQANLEPYVHAWQKGSHPTGAGVEDLKRNVTTTNGKSSFDHPTVKPDAVMNKIMKNVNGETVLDCFMGTGSTGIAAIRAGKKFIGVEKDPVFFSIACRRFFELYSVEMPDLVSH